jgi:hypothetical protein
VASPLAVQQVLFHPFVLFQVEGWVHHVQEGHDREELLVLELGHVQEEAHDQHNHVPALAFLYQEVMAHQEA